jgi:hypothetical protein
MAPQQPLNIKEGSGPSRASYVGGRKAADRTSLHPVDLNTVALPCGLIRRRS